VLCSISLIFQLQNEIAARPGCSGEETKAIFLIEPERDAITVNTVEKLDLDADLSARCSGSQTIYFYSNLHCLAAFATAAGPVVLIRQIALV